MVAWLVSLLGGPWLGGAWCRPERPASLDPLRGYHIRKWWDLRSMVCDGDFWLVSVVVCMSCGITPPPPPNQASFIRNQVNWGGGVWVGAPAWVGGSKIWDPPPC